MDIKNYVTYEQFGAVGDGVADDFLPIYNAHNYANEHGLTVKTDETKHYRIHYTFVGEGEDKKPEPIIIKTNVDWGKTKFTIDDSDLNPFDPWFKNMPKLPIFKVISDYAPEKITDEKILENILKDGLGTKTTKIDLGAKRDYPVMIIPCNEKHKIYRRSGPYAPSQDPNMSELIVLDKDGNVSPETPLMFNYNGLSYVTVYRIDDTPLTVKGGIFTTVACGLNARPEFMPDGTPNEARRDFGYFTRHISVERSNTVVEGVEHYMTNEVSLVRYAAGEVGPAYNGFYHAANANHITFKNCVLTGRRVFVHGSYELAASYVNKIVFDGCTQSNFWITIDDDYNIHPSYEGAPGARTSMTIDYEVNGTKIPYVHWGCGGTNFCKNMEYHNSRLSRFDAHMGLYNGKIKNCELNAIYLTGNGTMDIENVRFFANNPNTTHNTIILTRGDYGCVWNGEITIKNMDAYVYTDSPVALTGSIWQNWYYGYETILPDIAIENLNVYDVVTREPADENFSIQYIRGTNWGRAHLPEAHAAPTYQVVDRNGDGYVDDPFDQNTPLIFDGKPLTMDEAMSMLDPNSYYKLSLVDRSSTRNLNIKTPPKYFKLINSNAKFAVQKTDGEGIPNGAYFGVEEDGNGGFFGCTKFYYEKDKFIRGTAQDTAEIENCQIIFI